MNVDIRVPWTLFKAFEKKVGVTREEGKKGEKNKDSRKVGPSLKWQNQQNDCAPSEDADQPGHPPVWSKSSLCA